MIAHSCMMMKQEEIYITPQLELQNFFEGYTVPSKSLGTPVILV